MSSNAFTFNVRAKLCALAAALLLSGGVTTLARRQGHDMQSMPGMNMPKSKAKTKTKRKAGSKARQTARRKRGARPAPKKHEMQGMDMPMPSQSATPTPSPSPAQTRMESMPGMQMPAASPTPSMQASPQKTEMNNMPGMQMPVGSPSTTPQASPSPEQKTDMSMPMNMPMNNPTPHAVPSPTASPSDSVGMGGMNMPGRTHEGHDETQDMSGMDMSGTGSMNMGPLMVMSGDEMSIRVGASATNLMPMGRMGSGTSWLPGSTPMYMWDWSKGGWLWMLHGEAKVGVNRQGGPRGLTKFESQNWLMPMAFHRVGRGTLQLRGMFSLEPLTYSGAGSPQLFQAGESYRGRPLVDFQHPHDLFMEMSATYTLPVGERGTWFAYVGMPGEPALGPVAFMHRASASENPSAPLAHHLEDSTHISFGVFTTGFTYRWLKLEGSLFNGREPDEHRYNLEFNPWNSRSFRVTVAPNENWAVQYSFGLLKNPEALEPGDTRRQTASVQYNRPFERGNFAAALIWGRNRNDHGDGVTHQNGYTAEATVNFLDKNYTYTRLELVDREGLLDADELRRLGFSADARPQFRVGAYTFGAARDIWRTDNLSFALGGDFTLYSKPGVLDALYGRSPASYKLFLRIRPGKMKHGGQSVQGSHAGHSDE
jgi:hypothetical protein